MSVYGEVVTVFCVVFTAALTVFNHGRIIDIKAMLEHLTTTPPPPEPERKRGSDELLTNRN